MLLPKPEQFRDYIDEIDSPWVQAYRHRNMQKFASHEWIRILGKRASSSASRIKKMVLFVRRRCRMGQSPERTQSTSRAATL